MDKKKEPVIPKDEYFARLEQGIPVGNCWVDMGNGEFAYALHEIVAVSAPFNRYNDKMFMVQNISICCVADKTRVDTKHAEMQAMQIQGAMEQERKMNEMKKQLTKIVNDYFTAKKQSILFKAGSIEKMENLVSQERGFIDAIEHDDRPTPVFPFDLYISNKKLIDDFLHIRSLPIETGKDTDNWEANFETAMRMFFEWDLGIGPENRTYTNDRVANAFRNAWKVNEARRFFYNKYAGVAELTGASVTDYSGKFGLKGLFKAGIDPIEQFVGSYDIDIYVINGNMLKFVLTNKTSMKSFLYGKGPEWERNSFRLDGNTIQTYIFTEPIRR
jgi:hypothetical protein